MSDGDKWKGLKSRREKRESTCSGGCNFKYSPVTVRNTGHSRPVRELSRHHRPSRRHSHVCSIPAELSVRHFPTQRRGGRKVIVKGTHSRLLESQCLLILGNNS